MYKVANKNPCYNLENQVLERFDQTTKLGRLVGASIKTRSGPANISYSYTYFFGSGLKLSSSATLLKQLKFR